MTFLRGALLCLSFFTVLPVRVDAVDRSAGRVALAVAPVLGAALGALLGALAWGLVSLGAPSLLAGLVAVGAGALATRGMHLDGLADLADGLGSYAAPPRMLEVMRDPGVGAFAVIALVVALGAQAAALGGLAARGALPAVGGAAVALALGRAAFCWCGRRSVAAASEGGLGALVAGTQPSWCAPTWTIVLGVAAWAVRGVVGVAGVVVGALAAAALAAHAVRRLGGVTGDVFGAVCEAAATTALAVLALGALDG